jgi:hypothetical protein
MLQKSEGHTRQSMNELLDRPTNFYDIPLNPKKSFLTDLNVLTLGKNYSKECLPVILENEDY